MLVTDSALEPLDDGIESSSTSRRALAEMDDFVREMHTRSGLCLRQGRVKLDRGWRAGPRLRAQATSGGDCAAVRQLDRGRPSLPGRYLPELDTYLHYRSVDVSSFKELAGAGTPRRTGPAGEDETHRALADVHESIGNCGTTARRYCGTRLTWFNTACRAAIATDWGLLLHKDADDRLRGRSGRQPAGDLGLSPGDARTPGFGSPNPHSAPLPARSIAANDRGWAA